MGAGELCDEAACEFVSALLIVEKLVGQRFMEARILILRRQLSCFQVLPGRRLCVPLSQVDVAHLTEKSHLAAR
ncbi:hypothetical protein BVG81_003175 [Haliangium sp. UPWRP_2]|nr:hypothetical protein BVG81_003175 [Haliangium sp. UPWRP_2]